MTRFIAHFTVLLQSFYESFTIVLWHVLMLHKTPQTLSHILLSHTKYHIYIHPQMCPQISLIYSLTHNLYFIFITHVYPSFVISLDPLRKFSMSATSQSLSSDALFQFSVFSMSPARRDWVRKIKHTQHTQKYIYFVWHG
jgi:hypothetical protein